MEAASLPLFPANPRYLLAVDPGPESSAWVAYEPQVRAVRNFGHCPNDELLRLIRQRSDRALFLAVEMIASYGMPVGREVFETCLWIGRFVEAWQPGPHRLVYRKQVAVHLCGSARAKDPNVRAALIDLFGGSKQNAIGLKRSPGPLYGVSGDVWSALGVAVYAAEVAER